MAQQPSEQDHQAQATSIQVPKRAVVVLGSAANPPHRGHLHCLTVGKKHAESLGYQVLFTSIAIAPHGYVKRKMTDCSSPSESSVAPFALPDASRLQLLKLITTPTTTTTANDDDSTTFQCPDLAYGSALECGKAMRPDDAVAIVIVVGGDRAKSKWRKAPKPQQHGTVITICCARDQEQWQALQEAFAKDEKEGLVLDPNYHFALEVGPPTSSTMIRSILSHKETLEDEKVCALMEHGYSVEAARYLLTLTEEPP